MNSHDQSQLGQGVSDQKDEIQGQENQSSTSTQEEEKLPLEDNITSQYVSAGTLPEGLVPAEPGSPSPPPPKEITTEKWTPNKQRESARAWIAMWLLGLLTIVIIASFLTLWLGSATRIASMDSVLKLTFAPVLGLVGAVTGFYYGEKTANEGESATSDQ